MDADITQLAKRMRDRRAAGDSPYVLLLGSSLSLTPEVRRAVCGSDDWETFWTAVEKMAPAERRAAFKGPLERLLLVEGYRALARLLAAGYFEVVFTLNVDDTLDNALRVLKTDEYRVWVHDEVTSAELAAALEYRSPRVKVLKLRGDVNAHKLPLTVKGQFEFPPALEHAVTQWLSRDTMVVGDLPFDDDVWRCLRGSDSALWVVQTSEVFETSEVLRRVKQVRQKGEAITVESFNAFFTALADALKVEEVKPAWILPPQNPYQGLQAFTQDKARFFFGRERLTEKLLERLRRERFLAVVGASGSGKSSVVQAGLLHRLAQGALAGSAAWPTLVCRPGELVDALAQFLRGTEGISADERQDLLARAPADETAIDEIAERVLQDASPDCRLVLVVDQFEELFTLESTEYREQVIAALLYTVRAAGGRTTVVVTIRSDFYARVAEYDKLFVWMEQHRVFVPPMNRAELRDAIQRPARLVKFPLDDALTKTMLADVGREPGALPLLQYALKELYDRWQEGLTPLQAYREIGGVQGALEHRADEVYQALRDSHRQAVARHILIRLTRLGERTEDTRRRATFAELVTPMITLAEIEEVIDILAAAQNRLVVTDDPDKERPGHTRVVEVAHEALIRGWKRLQDWLDEDRAGLLLRQRLGEEAGEWDDVGRHEDYLYRGLELGKALEWVEGHEGELNELEQAFLDASVELQEREAAEREAQRQRKLDTARKLAATETQRAQEAEARAREQAKYATTLKRRNLFILGVGLVAVIVAIVAVHLALLSEARAVSVQAQNLLDDDPQLAVLLALASQKIAQTDGAAQIIAEAPYHYPPLEATLTGHTDWVHSVAWSPDGSRLASADGTVIVWDVASGQPITLAEEGPWGYFVTWSPDGAYLATGENGIDIWDAASGQHLTSMDEYFSSVESIAWSPDGSRLASAADEGIIVWDVATGQPVITFEETYTWDVLSVAWSPDGRQLVSSSEDTTVIIWDVASGQPVNLLDKHISKVSSVAWSPDGSCLASGSADNTILIWDVDTGQALTTLRGHTDEVTSVAWSPDGSWLASGSADRMVIVWDVASAQELTTLKGHTWQVLSVAWSPDGTRLASGSADYTVIVWDVAGGQPFTPLAEHTDDVNSIAWSPDGSRLASGAADNTVILWDVASGQSIITLTPDTEVVGTWPVTSVAWSPDGSRLASGAAGWVIWDVMSGQALTEMRWHVVSSLAWSPDGSHLASGGKDGSIIVWDVADDQFLTDLRTEHNVVNGVAWSPDGSRLAAGGDDGTIVIWDVVRGQHVTTPKGHASAVFSVAWSPDGSRLASGSAMPGYGPNDTTVVIWDVATHKPITTLKGHTHWVRSVAWSPDGRHLASGSEDNTILIWDVDSRQLVATLKGHTDKVTSVAWSPDGSYLASGSEDQRVLILNARFTLPPCHWLSHNLSHWEWKQYLPSYLSYREICPGLPIPIE